MSSGEQHVHPRGEAHDEAHGEAHGDVELHFGESCPCIVRVSLLCLSLIS